MACDTTNADPFAAIEADLVRLSQLTPGEIADELRAAGAKGQRQDPCNCPAGNYLRRRHPEIASGYLNGDGYEVQLKGGQRSDLHAVGDGLFDFFAFFDVGGFPDLEES